MGMGMGRTIKVQLGRAPTTTTKKMQRTRNEKVFGERVRYGGRSFWVVLHHLQASPSRSLKKLLPRYARISNASFKSTGGVKIVSTLRGQL